MPSPRKEANLLELFKASQGKHLDRRQINWIEEQAPALFNLNADNH
jgi:hypothetical protein